MTISMLIGGQNASALSGASFTRSDPVTGQDASIAPAASPKDAIRAAEAAAKAFPGWAKTGPSAKRALLLRAAEIMDAKVDDFKAAMMTETGATGPWAGFNVMLSANILREAAAMTTQISGEVIPADKPGTLAMAQRKPLGVCLGIAPWNAPVILATRAIAMPVACGNTVILKASEMCPATHRLIGDVFTEAGFPDGVLNILTNAPEDAPEVVDALIRHKAVRHVNFTGSTGVGRIIARLAAEELKPAVLELGGKAPLVVLEDADLDGAVNAAIFGSFMNQGQICMSTERIIVADKIADRFVEAMAARANGLRASDPRDNCPLGALVTRQSADKMRDLIDDALQKGARLVAGGRVDGAVVSATLLDHVTDKMRIYQEESFGPVKPIIRVADEAEAIRVANDTAYGLSSAVFSRDIRRAMAVADQIEAGICHINGPTVADEAQMPFGGVKDSGYGRFGGKAAVEAFTSVKWLTIEDPDQHYPF